MNSFALSAYNLSLEECALLKSLVILAAEKTRAPWTWTDDIASADVVVTTGTTAGRLSAHEDTLRAMGGPPHPVFIIDANAPDITDRLVLHRPLRLGDIGHRLEAAQIMIQSRRLIDSKAAILPQGLVWVEPHPDPVSVIDITSIDESGSPIQHHTSLYSAVASAYEVQREGVFSIRGRLWETIYVLPARRQFLSLTDHWADIHAGVEKLRSTLSHHSGSVVVEEVIDINLLCNVLRRRPEPGYRLIWLSAITLPPNFQTQYIDPGKYYLLKRLPDFHDLMHSEADLRMAAILLETPLNARGLSLLAGASLAGARSFLMACYASGLLLSRSYETLAAAT